MANYFLWTFEMSGSNTLALPRPDRRAAIVDSPSTASKQSPGTDQARWFAEEVQPHESSLRAYLRSSFPSQRDVDDLVQESYLRILRERAARPLRSVRGFLFEIARRLALNNLRRDKTAMHGAVKDFDADCVIQEGPGFAESISKREEVRLLAEAIHALPPRCREIMILRKMEGWSHKQIAAKLGIAEGTIEVQLARGMEKCGRYLRDRGVISPPQSE